MSVLDRVTPEMRRCVAAIEWPPLTAAQAGILGPLFIGALAPAKTPRRRSTAPQLRTEQRAA